MIKDAHLKIVEACREALGALTSSDKALRSAPTADAERKKESGI